MPFQSEAQRGFMYAKHPKIAKRFEEETPENAKLPEHIKKMNQGGMADDWKDDPASYMDEHFNQQGPQHMFDGGTAGNPDDSPSFMDRVSGFMQSPAAKMAGLLTNPVSGILEGMKSAAPGIMAAEKPILSGLQSFYGMNSPAPAAPSNTPTPQGPVQGPVFNPKAGLPPSVPPSTVPASNELSDYLVKTNESLDKYGPDKQMELEQAIQKQRHGFGANLANAGAGLADAIMQGVARAGPSNFQANLENRTDKGQEAQRQALEKAQTGNLAKIKEEMHLAQMDPSSAMSKMAQRAYGPTLKSMPGGQQLTDAQIAAIPASTIADILSKKVELGKALAEIANTQAFREATVGVQKATHEEAVRAHHAEEAEKAEAKKQKATETLAGQGTVKRFTNWATQNPAQKELQREAGVLPPATDFRTEAEAEAAGLPVGTEITINGRPARVR